MTIWELVASIDGHNRAEGGEAKPSPPTDAEFEAAKAAHGDN